MYPGSIKKTLSMKNFSLFIFILVIGSCSKCKEETGPNVNPCDVVRGEGYVFETGYEFVDGSCICPEGNYTAYGRCRALKENEWYGITDGCPCVDTLFLWLEKFEDDSIALFKTNDDVFDGFNTDPEYSLNDARTRRHGKYRYFTRLEGDSIAYVDSFYSDLIPCQLDSGPENEWVYMTGKFTPDRDTLFARFYYRDGATNFLIFLDSCDVLFTR